MVVSAVMLLSIIALGVTMAMRDNDDPKGSPEQDTTQGPANPTPTPEPEPSPTPEPAPEPEKWSNQKWFKAKDSDRDFKLSAEEFSSGASGQQQAKLVKLFNDLDSNGDGLLSASEFRKQKEEPK